MKPFSVLFTAILVSIAIVVAGCGKSTSAAPAESANAKERPAPGQAFIAADSPKLSQIRTESVESAMAPIGNVFAPGKVEANANRLSHVVLPVTGRVTTVLCKIGDYVHQGQPILTVESADAEAAVAAFQQATAAVSQAKSLMAKAQVDHDRQVDLFEHGAVPQKEVYNTQAVIVQAQAAVEQAQAGSEQAKRRLQILGIGSGVYGQQITIHAPISGKVLEMSVVNGEFRNDLSAPLMTIADLSSVWVTSDVPETAIRLVKPGESVRIELTAYPGETFHGRVALISDTVDAQTRTVKVRAELANPNGRLKPEMFGNMQLAAQTELRPMVPAAAIIATDGKTLVWREIRKGAFEKVAVTTGTQVGDRVVILSGLHENERIVVDGVMLLAS